jgi:hypothetical protein
MYGITAKLGVPISGGAWQRKRPLAYREGVFSLPPSALHTQGLRYDMLGVGADL